ncbi:phosphotransferase enzyme family protein [Clostridiales bacterium oral taxon 876 str. F0540]|nr:phosphotransferase enzyme family protein [Clostridiales bacterium oral taxon 876 str. F0540]
MEYGKLIGVGNTANVYEYGEGKVLKLFHQGYPVEDVAEEFNNAMAIRDMKFEKPKAHEVISFGGKSGIIYDKVEGESLLDWVMKTGDVKKCAEYMAKLHREIVQNTINNVSNYKDFLRSHILRACFKDFNKQKDALQLLDKLPEGDSLCHGDFHPGNILISNGNTIVLDFMNICQGNLLYDVARTVFLVEYTPVPEGDYDKEVLLQLKKTLTDLYLMEMNITREMIQDYLSVIALARKGECPNE